MIGQRANPKEGGGTNGGKKTLWGRGGEKKCKMK